MRPTHAEIDLKAIRDNIEEIASKIAPSQMCVVVKADAYGHGDVPVAIAAQEAGARWLAVALVEEGARLREAGIEAPILILSEPPAEDATELVRWGLTPTAYSPSFLDALGSSGAVCDVHLKVDTGMHRVGARLAMLPELMNTLATHPNLELGGLWTHFAVADEDPAFTRAQIDDFDEAIDGYEAPLVHMANTAGALLFPEARRDMCRIGLGIYGLHPCTATREVAQLTPAMRIVSRVSHVQHLDAGARPSYGRIRELQSDGPVATVPIGYADGFPRRLSDTSLALVGGRRRQLAGMVTMDQLVLDLTGSDVSVGDEVVLLGTQGAESIGADEWAESLGTISYEVVCGIGPRVPRRYVDE
ncbi:MAG: alanine racemase [Acidimicrobiia bacterium]